MDEISEMGKVALALGLEADAGTELILARVAALSRALKQVEAQYTFLYAEGLTCDANELSELHRVAEPGDLREILVAAGVDVAEIEAEERAQLPPGDDEEDEEDEEDEAERCPQCGYDISNDFFHCGRCGYEAQACDKCEGPLEYDSAVCPWCGYDHDSKTFRSGYPV